MHIIALPVTRNTNNIVYSKLKHHRDRSVQPPVINNYSKHSTVSPVFMARVDKSMIRFYDFNKDIMPLTVKNYIETLKNINIVTPIEAQTKAFEYLAIADTIDDIKAVYDKEPLFKNLINTEDSKAPTGLIKSINENKDILALDNQNILKNENNLTIYLLKKIFLELKTIDEINKDIELDLNEDLKADFKFKYGNSSSYIHSSTLDALGIGRPNPNYRTSLRFTQPEYSDNFALKVSIGVQNFYNSLTEEQKTERVKKIITRFETWWSTLPRSQKIEMLEAQEAELKMLNEYKSAANETKNKYSKKDKSSTDNISEYKPKSHIKVGSDVFANDELFKKWAMNNLKIFEAGLSAKEKEKLQEKRVFNQLQRWQNLSAAEKTEYISKLKTHGEIFRYTMIDAWNNSPEIIIALSEHLKEHQIYKPVNLLYSTEEFKEFQSVVMCDFWDKNPEFAILLGQNIKDSYKKIRTVLDNGTFAAIKQKIDEERNERIKFIEHFGKLKKNIANTRDIKDLTYKLITKETLKSAYKTTQLGNLSLIPDKYYNDYFRKAIDLLQPSLINTWIKALKQEKVPDEDLTLLKSNLKILSDNPDVQRFNNALELALAEELYTYTGDTRIYELSGKELKTVALRLQNGEKKADVRQGTYVFTFNKDFNPKTSISRATKFYDHNKQEMTEPECNYTVYKYFTGKPQEVIPPVLYKIKDYVASYGKGCLKILSRKSVYPIEQRIARYTKFINNTPADIKNQVDIVPYYLLPEQLVQEVELNKLERIIAKKYPFLPVEIPALYVENGKDTFLSKEFSIDEYAGKTLKANSYSNAAPQNDIFFLNKNVFDADDAIKMLCIEQALADVLYKATGGNEDVYNIPFELLCHFTSSFIKSSKKRMVMNGECQNYNKEQVSIEQKAKVDEKSILLKYKQYYKAMDEYTNEAKVMRFRDCDPYELLYILNSDETKALRDEYTKNRLKEYGFNI